MDTSLYGGIRGYGPEFHIGLGEWQKGNLHPQLGATGNRIRHERIKAHVSPLDTCRLSQNSARSRLNAPICGGRFTGNMSPRDGKCNVTRTTKSRLCEVKSSIRLTEPRRMATKPGFCCTPTSVRMQQDPQGCPVLAVPTNQVTAFSRLLFQGKNGIASRPFLNIRLLTDRPQVRILPGEPTSFFSVN
jgi:hypothetical protein